MNALASLLGRGNYFVPQLRRSIVDMLGRSLAPIAKGMNHAIDVVHPCYLRTIAEDVTAVQCQVLSVFQESHYFPNSYALTSKSVARVGLRIANVMLLNTC